MKLENDDEKPLFHSVEEVKKRKEKLIFSTTYIYMGLNPMWCSHDNFGELTLFLKYFIHPLIHHQFKNAYHVFIKQFM